MPESPPPERVDCTVQVGTIHVQGRQYSPSFMAWNLPQNQQVFQGRLLEILKANNGQMHYIEFLKEYKRRYPHG